MKILVTGLPDSGKTSILNEMELVEVKTVNPVVGFNVEMVNYQTITFVVLELNNKQHTELWESFLPDTDGVIFVVDSNDRERCEEAGKELHRIMKIEKLQDVVLLVLANKKDLQNAMNGEETAAKLHTSDLKVKKWRIQRTCATTGEGLHEAVDWFTDELRRRLKLHV